MSALLEMLFLYAFWRFGDPFPLLKEQKGLLSVSMGISRVGVVGVAVMSALSGFGAVSFPFLNIRFFMNEVTQDQVATAEKLLLQTFEKISIRKTKLLAAKARGQDGNTFNKRIESTASRVGHMLWSALGRNTTTSSSKYRSIVSISTLNKEIQQLEACSAEQYVELNDLRTEMDREKFSHTWRGRLYHVSGYFFSGYCLFKIIMSGINILFDRRASNDPITVALTIASERVGLTLDIAFWSQAISLVLTGVMVSLTIRGFLAQIMRFFSAFSTSMSSANVALVLTEVMGMYFVSTILLIRMSLPANYRAIITEVLGDIRFDFYHRWFDVIFIPSALITIFLIAVGRKTSVISANI